MIRSPVFRASLFALLFLLAAFVSAQSGTCSSTSKCASGCCSSSGYCGFGPDYCGKTCISDCDAQAQCGEYAAVNGTKCPLNVCCSEYGFCGTTTDFCGKGCQSGCAAPKEPGCSSSGTSANQKRIGYYESWSTTRTCNAWQPSDIDATKWTHLNFAFALIDQNTYGIAQMDPGDTKLYTEFTNLKQINPSLSVFISVGGWSAGGAVFSDMVSSASNRAAFISSLQTFMKTYAFDGVDIDWEYPVAPDRGGNPADFTNYVTFLAELRSALGTGHGISATLPSSYWYMQNFDIVNMEKYLDWFNIMTYDIHGTWDGQNPYTQAVVQAHTNLTEIKESLELLWRNNIDPSKVVLGLGFYGRSFTLKDPSCSTPGCPFSGGANPGKCTNTSGILSDQEIQDIISAYDLTPTLDSTAAVKYMTWDSNQWVSYDDAETFQMKVSFANSQCLAGTMAWAIDLDAVGLDTSADSLINGLTSKSVELVQATTRSNMLSIGLFWTVCLPYGTDEPCPTGYRPIAWGHGKVFDADLQYNRGEGCHGGGPKGFQRALCAANNIQYSSLQWGPGSASKACNSKCPTGWVTISKNSHISGQKSGCKSGKYAPLCAYEMYLKTSAYGNCYPSIGNQLLSGGLAARVDLLGITDFALQDLDGNSIPSMRKKKRQIGTGDGCGGELPIGDIPLEIPASMKVYGTDGVYYYVLEPEALPEPSKKKSKPTKTVHSETTSTSYSTMARTCPGDKYPQACFHYSSVAQSSTYSRATCSNVEKSRDYRRLPRSWNSGHKNGAWFKYIAKEYVNPDTTTKAISCQRDEWPPNHFQQGRPDGWVRYLPGDQNAGVPGFQPSSRGWREFCKFPPEKQVKKEGGPISDMGDYYLLTSYTSTIITLNVMSYTWDNVSPRVGDDYGLTANPCRPSVLTGDVGFALMTNDWWYTRNGGLPQSAYNGSPGALTKGKSQPQFKRWVSLDDSSVFNVLTYDDGNSTRLATDEEMEEMGYTRCMTPDCEEELAFLRQQQASVGLPTEVESRPTSTVMAVMTTTTSSTIAGKTALAAGSRLIASAKFSQITATAMLE